MPHFSSLDPSQAHSSWLGPRGIPEVTLFGSQGGGSWEKCLLAQVPNLGGGVGLLEENSH